MRLRNRLCGGVARTRKEDGGKRVKGPTLLILAVAFLLASLAGAQETKPIKVSQEDKCPVCGMFVAKYPDWVAQIIFRDGSYAAFDGAKDMFKYYFNLKKYNPSKNTTDIASIYVMDYYTLTLIDGFNAFYVIGSNVYGPMGRELIPSSKEEEAKDFMKDHSGKRILTFNEITQELAKSLDKET
jgi:nitrous oxide reductase accessory protein NosL